MAGRIVSTARAKVEVEAKEKERERIMKIAEINVVDEVVQAGRTLQRRGPEAMEGTVRTTARSVTTSWQRFSASLAGNTVIIPTNALKPIRLQLAIHQLLDSKRSRPKAKAKAKVKAGKARRPDGARMILKNF